MYHWTYLVVSVAFSSATLVAFAGNRFVDVQRGSPRQLAAAWRNSRVLVVAIQPGSSMGCLDWRTV
jgi:hypothetical protein